MSGAFTGAAVPAGTAGVPSDLRAQLLAIVRSNGSGIIGRAAISRALDAAGVPPLPLPVNPAFARLRTCLHEGRASIMVAADEAEALLAAMQPRPLPAVSDLKATAQLRGELLGLAQQSFGIAQMAGHDETLRAAFDQLGTAALNVASLLPAEARP